MAFINKISNFFLGIAEITPPTGVWENIIIAFNNGIFNYAWAIIVFTLVLKIALLPLDFFNKKITEKNTRLQSIVQPEIDKIQKQYGNNKQMINQKTMEIYKKYNYNVTGSCVIMLVNMALTLFIFITLFAGLNSMASYKVGYQYQEMEKVYYEYIDSTNYNGYWMEYLSAYNAKIATYITGEETIEDVTDEEILEAEEFARMAAEAAVGRTHEDIVDEINEAVLQKYNEIKDSWLWISNVWKSDTPWTKSVATFDEFVAMAGITYKEELPEGEDETFKVRLQESRDNDKAVYEDIMAAIEGEDRANGYLIIPILAVAATILSMLASQGKLKFKKKKGGAEEPAPAANPVKNPMGSWVMILLLSGLMGYITISYNSVFSLYILVGSLFGLATTPLLSLGIKKLNERQEKKKAEKIEVSYRRK